MKALRVAHLMEHAVVPNECPLIAFGVNGRHRFVVSHPLNLQVVDHRSAQRPSVDDFLDVTEPMELRQRVKFDLCHAGIVP